MLNDRDEKFEGHEENEYHFSDDEVSYEVEAESHEAAPASVTTEKPSPIKRFSSSRRLIISVVVVAVLVFVGYKMVAPSTSSTDITPVAVQTVKNPVKSSTLDFAALKRNALAANAQSTSAAAPGALSSAGPGSQPALGAAQQNVSTDPVLGAQTAPAGQSAMESASSVGGVPVASNSPTNNIPANNTASNKLPTAASSERLPSSMMLAQAAPNTGLSATSSAVPSAPSVGGMPGQQQVVVSAEMPVATSGQRPSQSPELGQQNMAAIDAKIASVSVNTEKLLSQLQSDYSQRMNDFETQSKALQDQLQQLNSRVGSMETQMNQLIQAIVRQNQSGGAQPVNDNPSASGTALPPAPQATPAAMPGQKSSYYNVQAIIPGRAWLKSDNGDTLTVAEGDVIRDFGRVIKIDPYDGIVEINTGNSVVSLSYGTQG